MTQKDLFDYCTLIRRKIEECKKEKFFQSFPNAFCALCSIWVYDFLFDKELNQIEIRQKNQFIHNYPHTWVHWKKFDIDITADQFNKIKIFPPVYVGYTCNLYKNFDNCSTKKNLFLTEFILKNAFIDNTFEKGIYSLYSKLGINIDLFYKIGFDC